MKRRNREEAYASSTRRTPRGKRLLSWLLSIVMLLSLLPGMELHAHAFWDDYDQGFQCPICDHYHWAENMCDCLFCTIDCNYECWVETHCNDCGLCLGDTPYWCEECFKCEECMEEKHCSTCAKCYIGEDDQLCGNCYKGPCCSITICDSCGFCDDCANDDSDPMHCSLCNNCFGTVDECVDDDDTGVIHCVDCHTACEQCEECLLNQESCEECGLCLECCRDNSDAGGCPDGETCVESAEWDEHICPGCDGWVTDKEDEDEFCEICELCRECCEGNSDCSEGMCAMDTDYADHFCEDCGLCFHDSDPCEDGCDQRCKDCCRDAVSAMGCDHDEWCFSDSDFENHLKEKHSGAEHTHIASSSWSADGTQHWHPCRYYDGEKLAAAGHEFDAKGVCKVCGYISGSAIVITRQPKSVKCKTSIYVDYDEEPENGLLYSENNWVTFSVSAKSLKGDELTYQWYQKYNANPAMAPYKLPDDVYYYEGVKTPTLKLSVPAESCQDDYSYFCVIGRKGDPTDTVKTAEAKLTATHAYSYQQAGVPVPTDDSERTPKYNVTWVDKNGVTHNGVVGGDPKCDGHKLPCLFEAGEYGAHYMTTGSKERIFPHKFKYDRSYDAVGGGRVDMLVCTVCEYEVPVKSHVHEYGWNWDCTGFGSIYEYTFNIGGSTKTVEQLILESGYAHPEKCKVPGCEEFIMVPHSWGRWNVVKNPDNAGGKGGMEAECSVCEYKETKKTDGDWTKDTALVTVKNGRATRMIVKPGDKIRLYPEERTGQKAIGWKVEYLREYNEYDIIGGMGLPVHKKWNANEAKSLFKLVTNGSALEWGCTIPAFRTMGAPGGGQFFFEPVYAACDHSGGTTVLNAKPQVCDRKGYTGDTACADCGHIISAGSDIYPPANAGHTGPLQPLYYYGTTNSATTDKTQSGKRYNASTGDCKHRAYEGDYRCTACSGTVKGKTGEFRHSGPFEWRDKRAATCTGKGYSGNQYCVKCDKIVQKGASTPSLHEIAGNYQLIHAVKPTCTAAGYSGDYKCTGDCGQIFRYGHVLNKLGHDWDSGKIATQGKSDGILYTCRRVGCGETKFVKGATLPKYVGAVKLTVTAPALGEEPKTEVTSDNGTESHFSVQSVSWNPADTAFAPYVKYTVSVALKAADGYTFAGNSCKINGENAALKIDSTDKTTATAVYTFAALSDAEAEKYQLVLWHCSAWYMDGDVKVESVEEDFYVPAGATVHLVADSSFQEDGFCRWVRVDDTDDTTLILNSRSLTDATLVMPAEYREVGPENHEFIPTQNACKDTENPAALLRPATCTDKGVYYLSCYHTGCYAVDHSQTFTTPAPGHDFGGAWLMDKSDHWQLCQRCFAEMSAHAAHDYDPKSETPNTCTCGYQRPEAGAEACEHEHTKLVNVKAPTCLDKGYTGDTVCTDCGVLVKPGTIIDAAGHQFGGEYEEYTKDPEHYHGKQCTNPGCDLWYALELHDFRQPTVLSKPECYQCGYQKVGGEIVRYLVTFFSDGELWYEQQTVEGGVLSDVPKAPPKSGYHFLGWYLEDGTEVTTSTVFGSDATATAKWKKIHSTGTAVSATTYPITVMDSKNGDVTASHKSASKGTTVTLTVDPDKGYVLDTLTVLDGKDKEIKLTEKNGKFTFTMPASKVTVEAAFKASAPTGKNPFIDVPAGSYYEDAVIWAVDKGITTGTCATTFNPNGICTRAQAVTFLWRAAGSPATKSAVMPFTDVKAGSYYYDAVLWAVETGITKGTSDTMFSPDATCSRAQIVTFLWRANGSPTASGNSAFTDVASDAYYAAAVTWAEKNGVTGGIGGGLFGSNNNCTRAQIVTFIYRSVK
ncbi:S-layer homology domain-containing protein [Oscillibacter sp. ER4]|uniref:S-layer homology domain-containing protein n=1 Tax=Oscillibacter sp. ER4 TaxID=1519439 RepID=UPI0009DDF3FC|nr:S-layer homology domain-containing protein [Oscillibacter sp. ER4]